MIIFYDKRDGRIFSTIDGRVHSEKTMKNSITDTSVPEEFVGKKIIGWEETNELEDFNEVSEDFEEVSKGLFKKVQKVVKLKRRKKIEHNLDKFNLLQRFEDDTPFSPMTHCKIDLKTGEFIEIEPNKSPNRLISKEEMVANMRKGREREIERIKARKLIKKEKLI